MPLPPETASTGVATSESDAAAASAREAGTCHAGCCCCWVAPWQLMPCALQVDGRWLLAVGKRTGRVEIDGISRYEILQLLVTA